jgi:hypothetical protein
MISSIRVNGSTERLVFEGAIECAKFRACIRPNVWYDNQSNAFLKTYALRGALRFSAAMFWLRSLKRRKVKEFPVKARFVSGPGARGFTACWKNGRGHYDILSLIFSFC